MRRRKSDYEIGEEHERLLVASQEREMFLLLFYRERVGRLVQRLRSESDYKASFMLKGKREPKRVYATIPNVAEWLAQFVARAEDETRCNDTIKSMYFCDRKKGHKGKHSEGPGLLSWEQE